MKNILFVCTGNSCRSQMAEGFGKAFAGGRFRVKSAGISPIGIHPSAIDTMKEVGIDISEQRSTMLTKDVLKWADYVVTLCDSARDNCPVIPPGITHVHWDIPNPDRIFLSEEARKSEFRRVRGRIKEQVGELFEGIK